MADLHDQFFPDDVDEQIEEYAQDQSLATPDNRLIYDLHQLYQEDTHIIQRVWERLSNHLPEEHVQHAASSRSSFKKFEPITGPLPKVSAHGNLARLINMLVATLMISLLLSKFVTVFSTTQTEQKGVSERKVAISAPFFYVTRRDGIYKIDPESGATLWHYALHPQQTHIFENSVTLTQNMLFFIHKDRQKGTQSLIALNIRNGMPLWQKPLDQGSYISSQLINGMIYISTRVNWNMQQGHIYAITASSGIIRWSHATDQVVRLGSAWQNRLYMTESNKLYTLNVPDGRPTIKRTFQAIFASAPSIVNNVLYASACQSTTPDHAERCRQYALDPLNGDDLWQSPDISPDSRNMPPAVSKGVLYLNSVHTGQLYALDTQNKGKVLWNREVGTGIQASPLAANASLYLAANTEEADTSRLLALEASTGSIRWSYTLGSTLSTLLTIQGNQLYYGSKDGTIQEHRLSDGALVHEYAIGTSSEDILSFAIGG